MAWFLRMKFSQKKKKHFSDLEENKSRKVFASQAKNDEKISKNKKMDKKNCNKLDN